jgi:hypothetical protein
MVRQQRTLYRHDDWLLGVKIEKKKWENTHPTLGSPQMHYLETGRDVPGASKIGQ